MRAPHRVLLTATICCVLVAMPSACGQRKPAAIPHVPEPTAGPPLTAVAGAVPLWVGGWPAVMLESSDAGATWKIKHQSTDPDVGMLTGVAVHGKHIFAVGMRSICASANGGATWTMQEVPASYRLNDVVCSDAAHAWAVGAQLVGDSYSAFHSVIFATSNGGRTWTSQVVRGVDGLTAVAFVNARHGWAVGGNSDTRVGYIIVTTDGGAHWRLQRRISGDSLHGVSFTDARHGWVVGGWGTKQPGIILATSDGGAHWRVQTSATPRYLLDVSFVDARHGWAVGYDGVILATSDGGKHWSDQSVSQLFTVRKVAFVNTRVGWAVFGHAKLLATRDGGHTWSVISPLPRYILLGAVACRPNSTRR